MRSIFIVVFLITYLLYHGTTLAEGARILAITPVPSHSHQLGYHTLWAALSRRGHKVVVLTPDPMGDASLTNLTEISLKFLYENVKNVDFIQNHADTWLTTSRTLVWNISEMAVENVYKHPEVREMYAPNSGQQFDIVFATIQSTPGIFALAHRFKASFIGLSPSGLYSHNYYSLGEPILTSHPSIWEMEDDTSFNLSLWRRIKNFALLWYHIYCSVHQLMPAQQAIAERYLGKDIPHINDIAKNISIVFYNQQDALSFVRPRTPNIIPYGYFHISKKPKVLPENLKQFIDDTPNGFIYISLGTNVVMSSLSKHALNALLHVFTNLPCKVLWKANFELSNNSNNIYISNWFPQQSILAHPKIKLFVYQGGMKSTEEAVHYAVPLLGLPVLSDQTCNVNKMVTLGVAKRLFINDISINALNSSIMDILNDKRYKERMLELKALSEDVPCDYLTNAIWWTEYVIRHKGAHHLRNSIAHDPWYQRYNLDIIVILSFVTFVIFVILSCIIIIMWKLLKMMLICYTKVPVTLKKKVS